MQCRLHSRAWGFRVPSNVFKIVLIKPSHYDNDGYVIRWWRGGLPSNSLACLYGIALECRERQVLRIRGLVRSRDVTPNNVILSTAIANMEVVFDGKGIVSDANKPGFLYRFFSWITPF